MGDGSDTMLLVCSVSHHSKQCRKQRVVHISEHATGQYDYGMRCSCCLLTC